MQKIKTISILLSLLCLISIPTPYIYANPENSKQARASATNSITQQINATKNFIAHHIKTIVKIVGALAIGILTYKYASPNPLSAERACAEAQEQRPREQEQAVGDPDPDQAQPDQAQREQDQLQALLLQGQEGQAEEQARAAAQALLQAQEAAAAEQAQALLLAEQLQAQAAAEEEQARQVLLVQQAEEQAQAAAQALLQVQQAAGEREQEAPIAGDAPFIGENADEASIRLAWQLANENQEDADFAAALELQDQQEEGELKGRAENNDPYTVRLPKGQLTKEALNRLKIQHTNRIPQGPSDCGVHVIVNAMLIDAIIKNKKYEKTIGINLSKHKTTHTQLYQNVALALEGETSDLQSHAIEQAINFLNLNNILVIETLAIPTVTIKAQIDTLKNKTYGACHFIFNTGGHWVLFSLRKINDTIHYYYTNSGKHYTSLHPILHPYINYIVQQATPGIFEGLEAPFVEWE